MECKFEMPILECVESNLIFCRKEIWSFVKALDYQVLEELVNLRLKYSFLTLVQVTPRVEVTPFYGTVPWNGVTLIDFGGFLKVLKICYITQAPATKCKTICLLALSFKPFPLVMINFLKIIWVKNRSTKLPRQMG